MRLAPLEFPSIDFIYASALVVALEKTPARLARALQSGFLRFYGKYSYGLYVIHLPAMVVMSHLGINIDTLSIGGSPLVGVLLYIAIVLPVVTLLALLSWNLLEKRFLTLKKRFAYRPPMLSAGKSPPCSSSGPS